MVPPKGVALLFHDSAQCRKGGTMIHRIGRMVVSLNSLDNKDIMSAFTVNCIFNPFTMLKESTEAVTDSKDDMTVKKVETKNTTICSKGVTVSFRGGYFRRFARRASGFWTGRAQL